MPGGAGGRPVCVIVGASSKWQADGSSTLREAGRDARSRPQQVPAEARWGAGGALALRFAAGGYAVALLTRKEANVRALADEVAARGGAARAFVCELADDRSIAAAFAEVRATLGAPEVLLYNAGYTSHGASEVLAEDLPVALIDAAHHTQARGALLCAKEVLAEMRRRGRGTVIFSSVPNAMYGSARNMTNSMTKAAQRGLAQALAEEYGPHGVTVGHVVIAGIIDSPGTRPFAQRPRARAMMLDAPALAEEYWRLHRRGPKGPGEVVVAPVTGVLARMRQRLDKWSTEVAVARPRL